MSLLRSQNAGQTGQNDCARPNSLPSLVLVSRGRAINRNSTYKRGHFRDAGHCEVDAKTHSTIRCASRWRAFRSRNPREL